MTAIILLASGAIVMGAIFPIVLLARMAAGSPDVNGDPEADAGLDSDDIAALQRHWDHGSFLADRHHHIYGTDRRPLPPTTPNPTHIHG